MKQIMIVLFFSLSCACAYSMELALCNSETCKKQIQKQQLQIKGYLEHIKELQEEISLSTSKLHESPYAITLNTDNGVRVFKGASVGGCCGFLSGVSALSAYRIADNCAWICWNVSTPTKILYDMMMYGFLGCTCVGCVAGACCAINRCDEKFNITFQ